MSVNESTRRLTIGLAKVLPEVNDGSIAVRSLAISEGDLALIAVESTMPDINATEKCSAVATCHPELAGLVGVKRLIFVKWDAAPERFIANAFEPVKITGVRFESDTLTSQTVAKVLVDEAGLDAIFDLDKGERPRLASVLTQHVLEIVISS
jgi:transcription antitermination factor NusA-like protein